MSGIAATPTLTTLFTLDTQYDLFPTGLAIDANGDLFGVVGSGTTGAFELANTGTGYAGTLTVLTGFGYEGPHGSLVSDSQGDLFGNTGGTLADGTVFEIVNSTGGSYTFETLVDFNGADGDITVGSFIFDSAGDLFGATEASNAGGGTVYEIVKTAGTYATAPTTLYTTSAGFHPSGGLVADAAGDLFGEAITQSVNGGNVTTTSIVYELVNNGQGTNTFQTISTLAAEPTFGSSLVIDSNGDLFGVTNSGGAYGYGAVFEVVKTATGYTSNPAILVSFYGGDGAGPEGLIIDAAGDLFGTTDSGGSYNNGTGDGTVFEIKRLASGYNNYPTVLANFSPSNGYSPLPGLAVDASGNLFGTTGGLSNYYYNSYATIFEITNSGYQVSCYLHGTRIATQAGECMVETLTQGDWVMTAAGVARPIIWIGHRHLDCRQHPKPADVWPVRVSAGAFGQGLPARDLFLSPDHAVFFNGALIPIRYLINDTTITQQAHDEVTYWHIELAQHDILLAEALPCESYLDTGNRSSFAGATIMSLHPAFAATAEDAWTHSACAPLVERGPGLAAARAFLAHRAVLLGCAETGVLDVRLDAAGWVSAVVPPDIHTVRLLSESFRIGRDRRLLGALLAELRVDGRSVPLDDSRLQRGFHEMERHGPASVRWTDGSATVRLGRGDTARRMDVRVAKAHVMQAARSAA